MDKEVSHFIDLAVSLLAVSVVVGVVMGTVMFGRLVRGDMFSYMLDVNKDVSNSLLISLEEVDDIIPSAAAYNILKSNNNSITKIDCKVCKTVETGFIDSPCIITHLKGNVSLEIKRDKSGLYAVTIHKKDCTWGTTTCNCN